MEEISTVSFINFNNNSGSYQAIVPSVAHYFLFNKEVDKYNINSKHTTVIRIHMMNLGL